MKIRGPEADWKLISFHALAATFRRPGRSAATTVGVALGIAVFLVTVGWSQTAGSQINQTFDELAATTLLIRDTQSGLAEDPGLPEDSQDRLQAIDGVVAGGRLWEGPRQLVQTSEVSAGHDVSILVADPGTLTAAKVTLAAGRFFDEIPQANGTPVGIIGRSLANELGISEVTPGLAVNLTKSHVNVAVVGILDSPGSSKEFEHALIVPPWAKVGLNGNVVSPIQAQQTGLVRVELGTASQIANAIPYALRPTDPTRLGVLVPPEPAALRGQVQGSLDSLAYGAAALSLLIGGIGIMNSMLNAVSQRAGEIGLRRSMGAARRHIVVQFLIEGALLGIIGSLGGLLVGEASLLGLSWFNDWAPVLSRTLLALAPVVGLLIGILASLYPAIRAASIKPSDTLRA